MRDRIEGEKGEREAESKEEARREREREGRYRLIISTDANLNSAPGQLRRPGPAAYLARAFVS